MPDGQTAGDPPEKKTLIVLAVLAGEGSIGSFADLEVIRAGAGMPTWRWCEVMGIPERTERRWRAKACTGHPPKGPSPSPARAVHRDAVCRVAGEHPTWGHRKIWAMARHAGLHVSPSTVLGGLDEAGLLLKADYQRATSSRELVKLCVG